jgi:hypothetical protein
MKIPLHIVRTMQARGGFSQNDLGIRGGDGDCNFPASNYISLYILACMAGGARALFYTACISQCV